MMVIAGPCVIDDRDRMFLIAEHLKAVCERLELGFVFKASFDKANRTSLNSYRGVGLDEGLKILDEVRQSVGVSVTTDLHLPDQAQAVGQVCDLLQICLLYTSPSPRDRG